MILKRLFSNSSTKLLYYRTKGVDPEKTYLQVKNSTPKQIITSVKDVDGFQWKSTHRPDLNFNNRVIQPGGILREKQEISPFARLNLFTLIFLFDVHTVLVFRVDQSIARDRPGKYAEYKPGSFPGVNMTPVVAQVDHLCSCLNKVPKNCFRGSEGLVTCQGNATYGVDITVRLNWTLHIEVFD